MNSRERRMPLLPLLCLSLFLFVSHASFGMPATTTGEFTPEEVASNLGNNLNKKLFSEEGNHKVTKAGKFNDPGTVHKQVVLPDLKPVILFSEEAGPFQKVQASVLKRRIIPLFVLYRNWRSAIL